jgi:hypothetical protein
MNTITLTFTDAECAKLECATRCRPQFADVTSFLQAHAQGAVDAGAQDQRNAIIATLEAAEGEDKAALDTIVEAVAVKVEAAKIDAVKVEAVIADEAVPSDIGIPQVIR